MTLPPGWLTDPEAKALARIAKGLNVLELGAWKGRSTVVLAGAARYVISVDRHQGIPGHGDSLDEYLANVRGLANVAVVVAAFEDFVPFLTDWEIGMVYIDGDHDADSVARDTTLALDVARNVIAFHDWDFPEVREGAAVAFGHSHEPDGLVGSVAWFTL